MKEKEERDLKALDLREKIKRVANHLQVDESVMSIARKLTAAEEEKSKLSNRMLELCTPAVNTNADKYISIGDEVLVMFVGMPRDEFAERCTVIGISNERTIFKAADGKMISSDRALIVRSIEDAKTISELMGEIADINIDANIELKTLRSEVVFSVQDMYNIMVKFLEVESVVYFKERSSISTAEGTEEPSEDNPKLLPDMSMLEHRFIRKDGTYVHGSIGMSNEHGLITFTDTTDIALLTPEDLKNGEVMSVIDFAICLNAAATSNDAVELFTASLAQAFEERGMVNNEE